MSPEAAKALETFRRDFGTRGKALEAIVLQQAAERARYKADAEHSKDMASYWRKRATEAEQRGRTEREILRSQRPASPRANQRGLRNLIIHLEAFLGDLKRTSPELSSAMERPRAEPESGTEP